MTVRFLLLNAYAIGGTVRTVANQANALAAAGHDVEIVSVRRHRENPQFTIDPRIRLRPLVDASDRVPALRRRAEALVQRRPSRLVPPDEVRHDRFNRLTDRRILRYLRSLDGGVLVTTRPALNLLAARFAPASVVKIGQEHLHLTRHKPGLAAEIDRWYRNLDAVTVLTAADEDAYRTVLAGSTVRVERIPNPLPPAAAERSTLRRPLLLAAGRLVKAKGFDALIRAFAPVVRGHGQWQLRIFGSGPERDRLRALIHEQHLYNHVFLMGSTAHLEQELAKASLFALSSRHEGFGMVLAEAMSHGVPVISFDCPQGPREIITHGDDGLLVPLGDIDGLTSAIARLIEDEQLREKMGAQAAESARRYSVDHIRPAWETLFAELLAAKSDPAPQRASPPRPYAL
ncbi:glycosyltransferase family 4 protein [Streptomyces sp. H27-D2]|uniref:glycosyltransferase family 4 protein n=1 Tax=Streptomyces sp. H27-D2 TaxID=3046304 RepID=UPI002DB5EC3F|nr:glycosyltransferase family 4 protein [Streptomyces sp. H27-D2]MEC4015387.1 glycosyltransferase family 4 protein [Streptomyces sp. H27-D2]